MTLRPLNFHKLIFNFVFYKLEDFQSVAPHLNPLPAKNLCGERIFGMQAQTPEKLNLEVRCTQNTLLFPKRSLCPKTTTNSPLPHLLRKWGEGVGLTSPTNFWKITPYPLPRLQKGVLRSIFEHSLYTV